MVFYHSKRKVATTEIFYGGYCSDRSDHDKFGRLCKIWDFGLGKWLSTNYNQALTRHPNRNLEASAKNYVNCGSPTQEVLEGSKDLNSNWGRGHYYDILASVLPLFQNFSWG